MASSISYETYAPRSTTQRDRLARIAELTAGPEALASKSTGGKSGAKGGINSGVAKDGAPSFLIKAISPEPLVVDDVDGITGGVSMNLAEDDPDDDMYASFLFQDDDSGDCMKNTGIGKGIRGNRGSSTANCEAIRQAMAVSGKTESALRSCIGTSSELRDALHAVVESAENISQRHDELIQHSGELSSACERLQQEESALSRHAEEIGAPLKHYDAVDSIGVKVGVLFKPGRVVVRGLARVKVDNEEYVDILDKIDDALAYFVHGEGALGAEGKEYGRRAVALHEAATFLIKEAVVDRLNQATSDIMAALNMPQRILPADKLEASLVYTRFHGISSRSNSLLTILQGRVHRTDVGSGYRELMDLCQNTYCQSRESLLRPTVRDHMDTLREQHGLVGMTRLASVFLMRLCSVETALYLDFFGMPVPKVEYVHRDQEHLELNGDAGKGAPAPAPAPATATAKEQLTAGSDGSGSVSGGRSSPPTVGRAPATTKNLPSTLDDEPFQRMLGSLCSALHRTVRRGVVQLSDMDTLCQVVGVLREERTTANASASTRATARAISGVISDAQERLIFCTQMVLQKEVVKFKPSKADLDYPAKLVDGVAGGFCGGGVTAVEDGEDVVQAQMKLYEGWWPPMRTVLRVLSKIFRVVEPRVFEDIALQAVQACTKTLKEAAAQIGSKQGVVHSDLFLVKHLLVLREQLSPFDIQLRAVERQLDFSEAGKAVTKFLANRNRRVFSMSTENALVTLLREGVSIQEHSVDSKRDLEDALRTACNDFIEHSTNRLAGRLMAFAEQGSSASSSARKTQAFMNGQTVQDLMVDARETATRELNTLKSNMSVYLESTATQSILLKPIARKIAKSLDDAKRFISEMSDGDHGWNASVRKDVLELMKDIENTMKEGSYNPVSR